MRSAFAALHRILKRHGDVRLHVAATLRAGGKAAERAASEAPLLARAAEERFEKVAEARALEALTGEFLTIEREARASAARSEGIAAEVLALLPVGAKLVIHLPLFIVFENFVGLVYFLELFLGVLVAGVEVRVILARKLFESFGNLVFGGFAPHTQYLVIVFIFHAHTQPPQDTRVRARPPDPGGGRSFNGSYVKLILCESRRRRRAGARLAPLKKKPVTATLSLPDPDPQRSRPMSSRPASASLLSLLPQPVQPIPGDSFNDRILLLLAAVATTDGMLTYREYQLVQEAAEAIFGERALHAALQAKLHYALLNPPSDPAAIARDMANQAEAQKVSASFVDAMLRALSIIGGQEERVDEKARSLVDDIEWAFRKARLERGGRSLTLGINVGESLGGLYRMATGVLPSRKDIREWFAPETSHFNADMERFAAELDRIAWTLDDMDLREELYLFRKMLRRQPFKIVIVGERKRGKSSLVNAIIGQEAVPGARNHAGNSHRGGVPLRPRPGLQRALPRLQPVRPA